MEERKRIVYIILIMSVLILCVGALSNTLLYRTHFEETKNRLEDTVKILAQLIGSQSDPVNGDLPADWPVNNHDRFTERIINAVSQYERHNRKIELTVAQKNGDDIHFIAALKHRGHADHPLVIGIHTGLAEPMRRALEGKSGTMVGKDYHGATVLAAYEHVPGLNLGVVAKIDMAEVRAPFIRTGLIIISISLLIIAAGIVAISRISSPLIVSLEEKADKLAAVNQEFERANEELAAANEELTASNEEMDASNEELQATMEEMEQTNEELIRSRQELILSETRVRAILEGSPIGIITADRATRRFVYANPSACAMFGYSCEEILTIGVDDIHPAKDREIIHAEFQSLINNEYQLSHDLPCLKKDGTLFYADISAVPVVFDGRPCLLGQFMDVSERKQAVEAIRESEERFAKAFHLSPISIAISSARNGEYIDVNNEFLALTGYSRDEVIGRTSEELNIWLNTEQNRLVHDELAAGRLVHDRQVEFRTKEGRILSVLYSAVAATIHGMPCLIKSVINITDRMESEAALRESEEKFAKAFINAPVLMSISDIENGTMIDVNERFLEQSGFTREEALGRSTIDLGWVRAADRDRYREKVKRDGIASGMELTVYPKGGGSRQVIYSGESIIIGGETRLLSIAVDITELKQAEEALQLQKDLAQMYLDIAGVMFVAIGADHKVILVNRKGCEILGYPGEQIVGSNWFDMAVPETIREDVRNVFNQMMRGEVQNVEYYENTVLTASGKERLIAWHNTLLKNSSGAITGTLSSGEDITERKKSEEDLHNQLALNMALAGISGSVISRSFTISETAYMVMEYARLLSDSGHGFVSEIDPDTGDNICHTMSNMMDTCPVVNTEKKIIFKKGADGRYPGLWGHALNTRREFFTNDPASHPASRGLPEGHVGITRFLSVPVLYGDTLVGQIALANSKRDYTGDDLKIARRFASIYAMAIVRIRDETMLMRSLEEKTVLIKELHHRVKNNMQVVSSLISLQALKIDNEKYRDLFMESSNRIQAMALVHEKMYHSGDMARVDFSRYASEIAERLLYSFSLEQGQVALDFDVRDIFLGIDEAIPCGIIINELVTNAFKHAFRDGRRGRLSISFVKLDDGRRRLVVHDDGPGIPGDIMDSAEKSLGMQIVTALTRQLDGTISMSGADGTRVELLF